jgi:hypothetical protein
MAKEIDVGASQMGVEILTNKGSEENPTKSVEIQKPPEKPYTIDDHSKMIEAMGQPEQAAKLKKQAVDALTEEGKIMNDNMTEEEIIHRGISYRKFERKFTLADDIGIQSAKLKDGLLSIELEQIVPEEKRPRTIEIK